MLIVLRLNYGNGIVRADEKKIVGFLRAVTLDHRSVQVDPACGDLRLHADVFRLPLFGDGRSNVTELNIFLTELFLVRHFHTPLSLKTESRKHASNLSHINEWQH